MGRRSAPPCVPGGRPRRPRPRPRRPRASPGPCRTPRPGPGPAPRTGAARPGRRRRRCPSRSGSPPARGARAPWATEANSSVADGRCPPTGGPADSSTRAPATRRCVPAGATSTSPGARGCPSTASRTGSGVVSSSQAARAASKPGPMCWTTTIGTGTPAGRARRMVARAAGPPVDAPTATSSAPARAAGWTPSPPPPAVAPPGGAAAWRRRKTRTSAMSLTVRTSSAASAVKPGAAGPRGLRRAASAPASSARTDWPASAGSSPPETTTIGAGCSRMMRRVASRPSMPGIWTSMVITSGCSRWASRMASAPLVASPTTSSPGSRPSREASSRLATSESSTTRTRTIR